MAFPETRWTMLARATLNGDEAGRRAMAELCERYWRPVYAAVRSAGAPDDEAREETQAFFAHVLENGTLRRADRERGRFRTFLLTVLWRFRRDRFRRESCARRGGGQAPVPLEEIEDTFAPPEAVTMTEAMDREWALGVLERVLAATGAGIISTRGPAAWEVLRGFLPGGLEPPSYARAAVVLGISEGGVRTEVHRLRERCRRELRRQLLETVSAPEEIDEEIAYLARLLQSGPVETGQTAPGVT